MMRRERRGQAVEVLGTLVLLGLVFMSLAGLGLAKNYRVWEMAGGAGEERTITKPVRYDLAVGQALRYRVKYISKSKVETSESARTDYAIEGFVEIVVTGRKDTGEYVLDLSTSVASFYSEDERQRGLSVDKEGKIKIAILLNPEGGVEFDKEEAARAMKANAIGQLHAHLFRAVVVVFPMLPKRWSASPIKGENDSWTFSYDCVGPIVVRGKQEAAGDEDNKGVIVEVVSAFAEGAVRSGYLKHMVYQKGEVLSESVLEVSLLPEKGDDKG